MNNKQKQKSIIEGILFVNGEPYSIKKISNFLKLSYKETKKIIEELKEEYQKRKSGLSFVEMDDKIQMVTSNYISYDLEKFLAKNFSENLSPALLETLSIIAYKGPISRLQIDEIRGVNSSYPLRMLLLRGLIEKESHPTIPNAFIYKVSFDFLRYLGINNLNELPEYERFRNEI